GGDRSGDRVRPLRGGRGSGPGRLCGDGAGGGGPSFRFPVPPRPAPDRRAVPDAKRCPACGSSHRVHGMRVGSVLLPSPRWHLGPPGHGGGAAGVTGAVSVEDALAAVRSRIHEACRRSGRTPGDVTLVAITKTVPLDDRR